MSAVRAELVRHGGIAHIHSRPVPGGWVNTVVCHDWHVRTLTPAEERALLAGGPIPWGIPA